MFQMVIAVMSIAMAGAAALATVSYANPTMVHEKRVQGQLEKGFETLSQGWNSYRDKNQTFRWECETYSTGSGDYEDCKRVIDSPGYLPVSGWVASLTPTYAFMPKAPGDMAWSYGSNLNGWYFCAEGAVNDVQLGGVYRAMNGFMVDQAFVANECGATASSPREQLNLSDLKVTYWVKRI